MAITKTWEINTMERDVSDGYVTKVIYRVKGISDSEEKARETGDLPPESSLELGKATSKRQIKESARTCRGNCRYK